MSLSERRKSMAGVNELSAVRYSYDVQFEEALSQGKLDEARSCLDQQARKAASADLLLPECYADLAQAFDRAGDHDAAVASMVCAIDHGWSGRPDPRSDIAEFHLRAGRGEEAARIWADLKLKDPDDVWLYNAAGLSYSEVGDHELAVEWLGEGIELAIRTGDPEGIVPQLSDVRRRSRAALGHCRDDLEQRAEAFAAEWRDRPGDRYSSSQLSRVADDRLAVPEVGQASRGGAGEVAVAMSWFPAGEYERAIERWQSLAEDWAGVPHPEYCRRMEGHIKWMRAHGIDVRALAPIVVNDFVVWCEAKGNDPEEARAQYAADRCRLGEAVDWPPGRNEPCWCGSGRKYKRCCGPVQAAPMHAESE